MLLKEILQESDQNTPEEVMDEIKHVANQFSSAYLRTSTNGKGTWMLSVDDDEEVTNSQDILKAINSAYEGIVGDLSGRHIKVMHNKRPFPAFLYDGIVCIKDTKHRKPNIFCGTKDKFDVPVQELSAEQKQNLEIIVKECQPFLKQVRQCSGLLYSGRKTKEDFIMNKQIRKDRQPVSTGLYAHFLADWWFEQQLGVRYRSNALFVTGNQNFANDYGKLFAIFPKGEFSFCWSRVVRDMFDYAEDDFYNQEWFEEIADEITSANVTRQMVYDAIDKHKDIWDEMDNYFDGTLGYLDEDLCGAIKSNHEVMIHAPEGIHLVSVDLLESLGPTFNEMFGLPNIKL